MIPETLQDRAALYASGSMTPAEREQFDLILEFHDELREFVAGLSDVAAALTFATLPAVPVLPSPGLKARILAKLAEHPQQSSSEGFVMCGTDGRVQWVNAAFTALRIRAAVSRSVFSPCRIGPRFFPRNSSTV